MNTQTEPAKIRWPKAIIKLTESDFSHGTWSIGRTADGATNYHAEPTACGTRCCAVGWVTSVFGECPSPDGIVQLKDGLTVDTGRGWDRDLRSGRNIYPKSSPVYKFAKKFAENLGVDPKNFSAEWNNRGLWALSDVFEEGLFRRGGAPTPAAAAKAWNKTLKDLGYVEACTVEWGDEE